MGYDTCILWEQLSLRVVLMCVFFFHPDVVKIPLSMYSAVHLCCLSVCEPHTRCRTHIKQRSVFKGALCDSGIKENLSLRVKISSPNLKSAPFEIWNKNAIYLYFGFLTFAVVSSLSIRDLNWFPSHASIDDGLHRISGMDFSTVRGVLSVPVISPTSSDCGITTPRYIMNPQNVSEKRLLPVWLMEVAMQ